MKALLALAAKLAEKSPRELYGRVLRTVSDEAQRFLPVRRSTALSLAEISPVTPWRSLHNLDVSAFSHDYVETLLAVADQTLAGTIFLGEGRSIRFADAPAWSTDPFTGRTAPDIWFTRVPYLDSRVVGDHKSTWDQSRLQWVLPLAQAWRVSGDMRYLNRADAVIESWMLANPVYWGMNWTSALEAAFRSITLTSYMHLTAGAVSGHREEICRRLVALIEQHARYIASHLSSWFAPNTHLTGEALALVVVGTAWPRLEQADRWVRSGWQILCDEAPRQIRPDGSYFEQSSWYLAYTIDFYLEAMRWGALTGRAFDADLVHRIRSGADLLRAVVRPDGSFVSLGDDDGGSLWRPIVPTIPSPVMTCVRAAVEFGDAELLPACALPVSALDTMSWEAHRERVSAVLGHRRPADPPGLAVRLFADGGLARIDDVSGVGSTPDCLVMDAGPHGTFGHSHDDPLSIDLTLRGWPAITDSGTASYSESATREFFRSVAAHATVTSPALPRAEANGPFGWRRRIDCRVRSIGQTGALAWLDAETVAANPAMDGSPSHRRVVLRLSQRAWLILDSVFVGLGVDATTTIRFPLAEGLDADQGQTVIAVSRGSRRQFALLADPTLTAVIERSRTSPRYGVVCTNQQIVLSGTAVNEGHWLTVLHAQPGEAVLLHRSGAASWTYTDSLGSVVIAPQNSMPDSLRDVVWTVTEIREGTPVTQTSISNARP